MKKYSKAINVIICIGIALCYIVLLRLFGTIWGVIITATDSSYLSEAVVGCMLSLVLLLCLFCAKKTEILAEKGIGFWEGTKVAGFLVVFTLILLASTLHSNIGVNQPKPFLSIVLFIIAMFFTGFCEEIVFRGMIQGILYERIGRDSKAGLYLSVVLSGLIFGALHVLNVFSGVQLKGAIIQAGGAVGVGMYFGAIYIRTRNLWVLILLHGFNDLVGLMGCGIYGLHTATDVISVYGIEKLGGVVLYIALALFLLRTSKIGRILPGGEPNSLDRIK